MKEITIWEERKSGEIVLLYPAEDRAEIDAMVYKNHGGGAWTRYEAQGVRAAFIATLSPLPEGKKEIVETVWGLYKKAFPDKVGKVELAWAAFPKGEMKFT